MKDFGDFGSVEMLVRGATKKKGRGRRGGFTLLSGAGGRTW